MSASSAPRPDHRASPLGSGSDPGPVPPSARTEPSAPEALALPLPLFPLHTVLFPGGALPLRIFEVRYLDMVARCHRENRPFGVVCLHAGGEVRDARERPAQLHTTGTLAHIRHFERRAPGLVLVECEGGQRFTMGAHQQAPNGLWSAQEAHALPPDGPFAIPDDLLPLQRGLKALAGHAVTDHTASTLPPLGQFPHWDDPRWNDCGWVANRWCELLPVPTEVRQRCMLLDTPLLRLELVADLLDHLGIRPEDALPARR